MTRTCEVCNKQDLSLDESILDLHEIIDNFGSNYAEMSEKYDLFGYFCIRCASQTLIKIEDTL